MSARRVVAAAVVLAALGVGVVVVTSSGGDGLTVRAEFSNANGLVPGNDVRVNGAPAGSVTGMELTDRGTAMVTMQLHDGLEPPRANATAAIRPVDLIGDNYVALEPGTADAPLRGTISTAKTLDAPRLDAVLRAFGEPERTGLKAMLVEGGMALDDRGTDLNRAALALRPTFEAADGVVRELGSQNANLRAFVGDAERVTAQAAERNHDLGGLVDSFDSTLHATADNAPALGSSISRLPSTLAQLRSTSSKLAGTAKAALPLASSVGRSAPALAHAAAQAKPFLSSTSRAAGNLHPVLGQATKVLENGDSTFAALRGGLDELKAVSPVLDRFFRVIVPAAPSISQGFFVNFPDQAAEPGKQPFDPFADPRRHYWRGAAVLTCQSFGQPIEPGCLQKFLNLGASATPSKARATGAERDAGTATNRSSPNTGAARSTGPSSPQGSSPTGSSSMGGSPSTGGSSGPLGGVGHTASDLLDLLFGP